MIGEGLYSRARLGRLASKTAKLRKQQGGEAMEQAKGRKLQRKSKALRRWYPGSLFSTKELTAWRGLQATPTQLSQQQLRKAEAKRVRPLPLGATAPPELGKTVWKRRALGENRCSTQPAPPHLGGGCKGYVFEDDHSHGVPGPSRFSHHGHKFDALGGAGIQGLQVLFLVVGISFSRCRRVPPCLSQGLLPLRRRDGEV